MDSPGKVVFMAELKVLIVEDSQTMAEMLKYVLSEKSSHPGEPNFNVAVVHSLGEAITTMQKSPPDAVLLDLLLPDAQDLEALATVRKKFKNIAVVVITQIFDFALGLKAIKDGAQDFIFKAHMQVDDLRRAILWAVAREQRDRKNRKES